MKSNGSKGLIGVIIVIAILLIGYFTIGNKIVRSENEVDSQYANVDTQLQRRNDLIPNLVEVTKGYAKHEDKIFTEIANARKEMISAGNSGDMSKVSEADGNLNSALGRLLALQESYPDLKANTQFTQLSDELAGTENRIAVARKDYNSAVKDYNNTVSVFPTSMVAKMKGAHKKAYFEASEGAKEVPTVDFNTSDSSDK